jgi:hypothetical protein
MFKKSPFVFVLLVLIAAATACSSSGTHTETYTEAEFNEDLADSGMTADFQPGQIVVSGDVEGQALEMVLTASVVDGGVSLEVASVTLNGTPMDLNLFTGMGAELSQVFYTEDTNYVVEDITITDTEITVTSTRQ